MHETKMHYLLLFLCEYICICLIYTIHKYLQENSGFYPRDENGKILASDVDYLDTWKVMESCVEKGLVRSIGVSNFNSQQLVRLMEVCTIKPVTNQVCYSSAHLNSYLKCRQNRLNFMSIFLKKN